MEQTVNEGLKNALEQAKLKKEFIKVLFLYPGAARRTIKSGHVIKTYDDSFDFNEVYDGHSTYSYSYLLQVIRPQVEATVPDNTETGPNSHTKSYRGENGNGNV